MGSAPPPCCKRAVSWIQAHKGKGCFAPFTGQDGPAWKTFVHAVELYGSSDNAGRAGAIAAMRGAVAAMQPGLRHMARDVIPCILDWSHMVEIWPKVTPEIPLIDSHSPRAHLDELAYHPGGSHG